MEVIIRPTKEDAELLTAQIIAKTVCEKPHTTLGLATGRTMEKLYAKLIQLHREQDLDFSLVRTFNLDEYIGLPPQHRNSYRFYMNTHLFDDINVDKRNTHLPNGMADDLEAECRRYDSLIKEHGGIDLQLLGLGQAGHIGFNEPLSALRSRTREKALTPLTLEENAQLFDNTDEVPRRAITMGVGTILEAQHIVMLVTGEPKAAILAKAVEGPITAMVSATALQLHPKCQVICDEGAAAELQGVDYYRWIFENEPEWAPFRP